MSHLSVDYTEHSIFCFLLLQKEFKISKIFSRGFYLNCKNIPNFGFVRMKYVAKNGVHWFIILPIICICPKNNIKPIVFSSFQPADKKKFPYGGMNSKKSKYFIYIFMLFFRKSKIEYFYFSFKLSLTTVCWVNFRKNYETIWP